MNRLLITKEKNANNTNINNNRRPVVTIRRTFNDTGSVSSGYSSSTASSIDDAEYDLSSMLGTTTIDQEAVVTLDSITCDDVMRFSFKKLMHKYTFMQMRCSAKRERDLATSAQFTKKRRADYFVECSRCTDFKLARSRVLSLIVDMTRNNNIDDSYIKYCLSGEQQQEEEEEEAINKDSDSDYENDGHELDYECMHYCDMNSNGEDESERVTLASLDYTMASSILNVKRLVKRIFCLLEQQTIKHSQECARTIVSSSPSKCTKSCGGRHLTTNCLMLPPLSLSPSTSSCATTTTTTTPLVKKLIEDKTITTHGNANKAANSCSATKKSDASLPSCASASCYSGKENSTTCGPAATTLQSSSSSVEQVIVKKEEDDDDDCLSITNATSSQEEEEEEEEEGQHIVELSVNDDEEDYGDDEEDEEEDEGNYEDEDDDEQQQQQKQQSSTEQQQQSAGGGGPHQSLLKAINKRKLHINCPLCESSVVNMSDHLVKKHAIRDRNQRKYFMDMIRRTYLRHQHSNKSANAVTVTAKTNLNSVQASPKSQPSPSSLSNNNKSNVVSTQQIAKTTSTSTTTTTTTEAATPVVAAAAAPIQPRKMIKCPICMDDNKCFVNISDHFIKIHHLVTSEQRKPLLKLIKAKQQQEQMQKHQQQQQQQLLLSTSSLSSPSQKPPSAETETSENLRMLQAAAAMMLMSPQHQDRRSHVENSRSYLSPPPSKQTSGGSLMSPRDINIDNPASVSSSVYMPVSPYSATPLTPLDVSSYARLEQQQRARQSLPHQQQQQQQLISFKRKLSSSLDSTATGGVAMSPAAVISSVMSSMSMKQAKFVAPSPSNKQYDELQQLYNESDLLPPPPPQQPIPKRHNYEQQQQQHERKEAAVVSEQQSCFALPPEHSSIKLPISVSTTKSSAFSAVQASSLPSLGRPPPAAAVAAAVKPDCQQMWSKLCSIESKLNRTIETFNFFSETVFSQMRTISNELRSTSHEIKQVKSCIEQHKQQLCPPCPQSVVEEAAAYGQQQNFYRSQQESSKCECNQRNCTSSSSTPFIQQQQQQQLSPLSSSSLSSSYTKPFIHPWSLSEATVSSLSSSSGANLASSTYVPAPLTIFNIQQQKQQ